MLLHISEMFGYAIYLIMSFSYATFPWPMFLNLALAHATQIWESRAICHFIISISPNLAGWKLYQLVSWNTPQEHTVKYMHFSLLDLHRKYYLIYRSQPLKPQAGDTQQMGPMETGGTTIGDPLPSPKCPGVGRCGHLSGSPDRWQTTLTQAMKYVWKEDVMT